MATPRKGQRYRANADVELGGVISYSGPFTGGFRGTFPAGATLTVEDDPPAFARGLYLRPDDYDRFETFFVPVGDRNAQNYSGYAVVLTFDELERLFTVVDAG